MRLAAIDIGSNAVRLLIGEVFNTKGEQKPKFRKVKLFRLPVRLGMDSFLNKKILAKNEERLHRTMHIFKELMDLYEVVAHRAYATSAMREAENAGKIIKQVKKQTGIKIEIIDGQTEAMLILSNKELLGDSFDPRFSHLYVDVGGGSTEISLLEGNGISESKSFKIGTIRVLKDIAKIENWAAMKKWLIEDIRPKNPLNIIGSGGNINRVLKRSGNMRFQPLMYEQLKRERNLLATLSIEDRVQLQDLNQDRAEVIVPALDIFLFVMKHTGIRQVMVPKIGVADGILREIHEEHLKG